MEEARQDTQVNTSSAALLRPVLVSAVLFMLVCGLAYPLLTTAVAQILFPHQAEGSLMERNGEAIGSELIAQQFTEPEYFHPHPSATDPPYNAALSAATNYGPRMRHSSSRWRGVSRSIAR